MNAKAQKTISFPSLDGLPITADFYESSTSDPYLILFHQARFSRGEYKETAAKFVKLGYNCLAIDQRSGNEVNFVKNKTAEAAAEKGLPTEYLDAKQDMQAAINYISKVSDKPIVLFGSSYSASLSLILAKENENIKAVIAFSPGEYFNNLSIAKTIKGVKIPVFAASSTDEFSYMKNMFDTAGLKNVNLFKPKGKGVHGSKALWENNSESKEYWLALMMFFSQLKEE